MRPIDALITGFVKSPLLLEQSLAPLRQLRQEGVIRHIHYVTWDSAELDLFVAPLAQMPDVQLTRLAPPAAPGIPNQRGIVYQVRSLEAGLALLPDRDGLILKIRPDFVAKSDFLRRKILNFERDCAVPPRRSLLGVTMPPPVLQNKIWIPWADSNQPFFFEDALFMGNTRDIHRLVTPLDDADHAVLGDILCGGYAHTVRYAKLFTAQWPIFLNYLRHYRCYVNNIDYRMKLVPLILDDGFFWHLLVAHAWILHSQFHVDAGEQGDMLFYANTVNQDTDWSRPPTWQLANPYEDIACWRDGTRPGEATHSVRRVFGRLVDDAWHTALFTQPLSDFPKETLCSLMENVAAGDGRLAEIERAFYAKLESFYHANSAMAKTG